MKKETTEKKKEKKTGKKIGFLAKTLLCSTALSTVLQFCPGLVSQPYDDFMKAKGAPGDLSQHFHAANIRVYGRYNPLVPFHAAGRAFRETWDEEMAHKKNGVGKVLAASIAAPLSYFGTLTDASEDILFGPVSPLDAWTMRDQVPFEERSVFIRPAGSATAEEYVKDFSVIALKEDLKFKNDAKELEKVIFEYVMLHEARHGDQDNDVLESIDESDADLYAFKVLKARGIKPELLEEAMTVITHIRNLAAGLGDDSHVTGPSMKRGGQTILEGSSDVADFDRLYLALESVYKKNEDIFPDDMNKKKSKLHIAVAAQRANLFSGDPLLEKTNAVFVESVSYLNEISNGGVIDKSFDLSKIDLSMIKKEYKPAPDKLSVPVPAAQKKIKPPSLS